MSHPLVGTIGYTLGVAQPSDTRIHRVWASIPGEALCGVQCDYRPNVPAEATGTVCRTCVELEDADDPRDSGPYHDADSYMRRLDR